MNPFVPLRIFILMTCFLASNLVCKSQDVLAGSFSNGMYENKTLGFMIKNIPVQWRCTLNVKSDNVESDDYPIFETLGDSLQILAVLTDSSRMSFNMPMKIFLLVEPLNAYESLGANTELQFFSVNKDRVLAKVTAGYPKFTFNEVRSTNNIGGEEFFYQGNKIIMGENSERNQIAFCSIREGYFFIILVDGFRHDQDLQEATSVLKQFWWTK